MAAALLVFARSMRVEVASAGNRMSAVQASAVERAAEQYVLSQVDGTDGDPTAILTAPAEQMQVGDGYFWLVRPYADDPQAQTFDFGLVDESSKLHLNIASADDMANLPGMTLDRAESVVDWRDADDTPTDQGVESSYYNSLSDAPYSAKNAPLETVEELALVKDMDPTILYGYDTNRNGVIDESEGAAGGIANAVNSGGDAGRGIIPFVTVYSTEPNTASDGSARVNVVTAFAAAAPGRPGTTGGGAKPPAARDGDCRRHRRELRRGAAGACRRATVGAGGPDHDPRHRLPAVRQRPGLRGQDQAHARRVSPGRRQTHRHRRQDAHRIGERQHRAAGGPAVPAGADRQRR